MGTRLAGGGGGLVKSGPIVNPYPSSLCTLLSLSFPTSQTKMAYLLSLLVSLQVKSFLQAPMEGIVLETYGSGNAPDNRADLLEEFRNATERGVIMVNCTQCLRGSVTTSYATGKVPQNTVFSGRVHMMWMDVC